MKSTIGVILGIILGVIIVATIAVVLILDVFGPSPRNANVQTPKPSPGFSIASPSTLPSTGNVATSKIPTANASPANSPPVVTREAVNFTLSITSVENTGLTSRKVIGQITNTGTNDAHNVSAKAEVFCQGTSVKVNGQDNISQYLGTIKAGETVAEAMDLSFSIMDAAKIAQNGATINLNITSDERTLTLSYNYHP